MAASSKIRHEPKGYRLDVTGMPRPWWKVIRPQSPFGEGQPYSFLPVDLHAPLPLLMIRLTDSADDDGLVDDFCACFHLSKKAVLAAVQAYRNASRTVH